MGGEVFRPVVFEQEGESDPIVVRKDDGHARNYEVDVAISVHVRTLDMDWATKIAR